MFHRQASGALAVAVCVGCLAPTSAVAALEPGVHIDPGSPAAKEYGVPLWVLRGEASGHQSPEGIPPSPLFGVGIEPPGAGGGRARGGGAANRGRGPGGPGSRRARLASGSGSVPSAATIAQLTRQGSSASQVGLLVGAVLIGGLVLGGAFALGRRAVDR
jgi:hypothetical protein